ncbi:MAG: hypothetical protein QNI87_09320 [Erythrobacter sp.]|uniref:hypothetical protein n=1 Tax=Erythrobacter sp. TaxID=1042 RepID=UPI002619178D|nr:hypothetical protein [Erythrobacter sp.]MDJ0978725.1 hypothetical protein [Erythrobacter sp.]
MRAKTPSRWAALAIGAVALAACKPPPTDAGMNRAMPDPAPTYASEPLPSPDTEGALWTASARDGNRIIYGVPGSPALMSLDCLTDEKQARVRITRPSPADEGAKALMALVGNGHIGRIEVDATHVEGAMVWRGEAPADDRDLEPLAGPRAVNATVPGGGLVKLNASDLPMRLVERCREG